MATQFEVKHLNFPKLPHFQLLVLQQPHFDHFFYFETVYWKWSLWGKTQNSQIRINQGSETLE